MVFLAFPEVAMLDLVGPWEVFATANRLATGRIPAYSLELVSDDEGSEIGTQNGISMVSHYSASMCRGAIDTLVVPAADLSWTWEASSPSARLLRRLANRSRRVVSVCAGAFFLAAAGLLDGKTATTHWRGAKELSTRYPRVNVEPDSIFVKDGNTYTSAGVTAGIDLALALVEEDLGRALALECARNLVVFMCRPGGQSQFSSALEAQHTERSAIGDLVSWIAAHPSSDLTVSAMAERAQMSPRNFSRIFRREVGQTPASFVEKLRVEAARRRLEETSLSLDTIAEECGFSGADVMRRSFHRVLSVAPSDYRQRFHPRR
ncbi:MAG: helix-turn-helix domain-containing protein [Myxococcota bacterium]